MKRSMGLLRVLTRAPCVAAGFMAPACSRGASSWAVLRVRARSFKRLVKGTWSIPSTGTKVEDPTSSVSACVLASCSSCCDTCWPWDASPVSALAWLRERFALLRVVRPGLTCTCVLRLVWVSEPSLDLCGLASLPSRVSSHTQRQTQALCDKASGTMVGVEKVQPER